jgi:5-amino-6-(5-phosphoribosylamino)uracil reductase/diaminohydroxyphosphoribosylaminopyrimidine deaminase/5-amino-6-(5-phosphoribosylamino)uracil reductase
VLAHRLRAEHDAILVGVATVLIDNPQLTTRLVEGPDPIRVVLDSRLRTPPEAAVVRPGTVIATLETAPVQRETRLVNQGAEVLRLPGREGRVHEHVLLSTLRERGMRTLLLEGGAEVITSFLRERLADDVVVLLAPVVAGSGRDAVGDLGVAVMDSSIRFEGARFAQIGEDALFEGRPVWPR